MAPRSARCPIGPDLIAAAPRWKAMVNAMSRPWPPTPPVLAEPQRRCAGLEPLSPRTIPGPETGDLQTVITGFTEPLDTWADMTDLLRARDWPQRRADADRLFLQSRPRCRRRSRPLPRPRPGLADTDLVRMWPGAARDGGSTPRSCGRGPARTRGRLPRPVFPAELLRS